MLHIEHYGIRIGETFGSIKRERSGDGLYIAVLPTESEMHSLNLHVACVHQDKTVRREAYIIADYPQAADDILTLAEEHEVKCVTVITRKINRSELRDSLSDLARCGDLIPIPEYVWSANDGLAFWPNNHLVI